MSDWIDTPLPQGPGMPPPGKANDWLSMSIPKVGSATAPKTDTSAMQAFVGGMAKSMPWGLAGNPGSQPFQGPQGLQIGQEGGIGQEIQNATQSAQAANPNTATAGKYLNTALLGGLTGSGPLGMLKGAGQAALSQGGADTANVLFPNSTAAQIVGSLAAPAAGASLITALKGAGGSVMRAAIPNASNAQNMSALYKQNNIQPSLSELTGSPTAQMAESTLQKVPLVGTANFFKNRPGQFADRAAQINQGLQSAAPPGTVDFNQAAQQAAMNLYKQNSATGNNLYQKVSQLVPLTESSSMNNTKNVATDLVKGQTANSDVISPPAYVQAVQKFTNIQPKSFTDMQALRSQVNDAAMSAQFGSPEARAYKMLRGGIDQDMQSLADSQGGAVQTAFRQAQDYWKNNVIPFKSINKLRSLTQGTMDTDTLTNAFFQPNRPQLANTLLKNLPPEGVASTQAAVIGSMFKKAGLGDPSGNFSAEKFANAWNNMGTTKDALFANNPELKQQIDGYAKIIKASGRYLDPRVNTGAAAIPWLLSGGATALVTSGHTASGSALIPAMYGLSKLTTTPWGQRLLLTAAQSNDQSLLKRLGASAQAQLISTAANPGSISAASQGNQ